MSGAAETYQSTTADDLAGPAPAVVVFTGDTSLGCLRILKPGFRHCFVAVCRNDHWVICDPLCHRTDLLVISKDAAGDLGAWYRLRGLTVIATWVRPAPPRIAPLSAYTCVEAVKRILGIHARSVNTPWQLYRHLSQSF